MAKKSYQEIADILEIAKKVVAIWSWYQHYKWTKYFVVDLAISFVDDELQTEVIYFPEWYENTKFIRSFDQFVSEINIKWIQTLRFKKIDST